jgi:hypothetical protein
VTIIDSQVVGAYGVRHRWPDWSQPQVVPCATLADAEATLRDLGLTGLTRMEIVTRDGDGWRLCPEGLIADVRELAEAYADEELDDADVREQLAEWLPGRDIDDVMSGPWPELLEDIEAYRRADDGDVDWNMVDPELRDPELLVQHHDGLVIDAVKRVIGGAK